MMYMIAAIEFHLPPVDPIYRDIVAVREVNLQVTPFRLGSTISVHAFHQAILVNGTLTWQVESLAVCTLIAGNRFWNRAVGSLSSGRPAV